MDAFGFAHDRIATLRWRGGADALAARRAIERALAPMDWGARGEAIVCVRRLRGTLRAGGAVAACDGRPWRERLDSLAAGAPRPWREGVPTGAQAVVFADEAELLACLARDVVHGRVAAAWWWPALLGGPADLALVQRRWRAEPTLLPAVLRRLAAGGEAATVLAAWSPPALDALAADLASAFGVAWPADAWRQGPGRILATVLADWPPALHPQVASWRAEVRALLGPGALATPEVVRWIGLAWALAAHPRLARMPRFATLVETAALAHTRMPEPTPSRPAGLAHEAGGKATGWAAQAGVPPLSVDAARDAGPQAAQVASSPSQLHDPVEPGPSLPPEERRQETTAQQSTAHEDALHAPDAVPAASSASVGPAAAPTAFAPPDLLQAESAFAGTLYLLPIAVHLGWYGDFTQPRAIGLALHPADLLALLGQRIGGEAWNEDPLPRLLAAWAGRAPEDTAGVGFVPEDGLFLDAWLAARERALAGRAALALEQPVHAVLHWLAARPGRIALGESTVDAHFDLATHPLAIRCAGLDRDLGWLPAGGRRVRFHFHLQAGP